jgi:hypothetical protein
VRLGRRIKCKKCSLKVERQDAYRDWHNVDCFESAYVPGATGSLVWIKNWWICTGCYPTYLSRVSRFHGIDGFTYRVSWKFPFVQRF